MVTSVYERRLQDIMVAVFIKTHVHIQSNMMNKTYHDSAGMYQRVDKEELLAFLPTHKAAPAHYKNAIMDSFSDISQAGLSHGLK